MENNKNKDSKHQKSGPTKAPEYHHGTHNRYNHQHPQEYPNFSGKMHEHPHSVKDVHSDEVHSHQHSPEDLHFGHKHPSEQMQGPHDHPHHPNDMHGQMAKGQGQEMHGHPHSPEDLHFGQKHPKEQMKGPHDHPHYPNDPHGQMDVNMDEKMWKGQGPSQEMHAHPHDPEDLHFGHKHPGKDMQGPHDHPHSPSDQHGEAESMGEEMHSHPHPENDPHFEQGQGQKQWSQGQRPYMMPGQEDKRKSGRDYEGEIKKLEDQVEYLSSKILSLEMENKESMETYKKSAKVLEGKAQEQLNEFKKTMSQRLEEEKKDFWKYGSQKLLETIIKPLLNIELAISSGKNQDKSIADYVVGFEMLLNQLNDDLQDFGVSRIEPKVGDKFDPISHYAISTKEGNNKNTIIEVKKAGYKLHDRVIEPAIVVIEI